MASEGVSGWMACNNIVCINSCQVLVVFNKCFHTRIAMLELSKYMATAKDIRVESVFANG
jgi:hypothetical protein